MKPLEMRAAETIIEEVQSYGAELKTAGHAGVRIEDRIRLPDTLIEEIQANTKALRDYLDEQYRAQLTDQLIKELARLNHEGGGEKNALVAFRDQLRLNSAFDLSGHDKNIKSLKRELAKKRKEGNTTEVERLTWKLARAEECRARDCRRRECLEVALKAISETAGLQDRGETLA